LSMAVSMAVLMAVVGEGAGESVDPDPAVPTVAPIDEVLPRQCPCLWAFETWSASGIRRTRRRSDESKGTQGLPRFAPLGRVKTYVLLV
jgi:hypothetical protein